jgi:hypothetical protein
MFGDDKEFKLGKGVKLLDKVFRELFNEFSVGSSTNIPIFTKTSVYSNYHKVSDEDIKVFHFRVINSLGAPQMVLLFSLSDVTVDIVDITHAVGVATVEAPGHTLAVDDYVLIEGVTGAVEANGIWRVVASDTTAGTFTFALGAMTAYTAAGTLNSLGDEIIEPYLCSTDHIWISFGDGRRFPNGLLLCTSIDADPLVCDLGAEDCLFYSAYYPITK